MVTPTLTVVTGPNTLAQQKSRNMYTLETTAINVPVIYADPGAHHLHRLAAQQPPAIQLAAIGQLGGATGRVRRFLPLVVNAEVPRVAVDP